jgi:hypothetical protein
MLDFDFEKLCSISLSNLNVYACLVCGKYFQGYNLSFLFIIIQKEEAKVLMLSHILWKWIIICLSI